MREMVKENIPEEIGSAIDMILDSEWNVRIEKNGNISLMPPLYGPPIGFRGNFIVGQIEIDSVILESETPIGENSRLTT